MYLFIDIDITGDINVDIIYMSLKGLDLLMSSDKFMVIEYGLMGESKYFRFFIYFFLNYYGNYAT
jgi:hypothetical protein